MAEYIAREALIAAIENDCPEMVNYSKREAIDCIKAEPAADVVEVKRGRWETVYRYESEDFEEKRCSACKAHLIVRWYDRSMEYRFCPNCGADMREVREDETG